MYAGLWHAGLLRKAAAVAGATAWAPGDAAVALGVLFDPSDISTLWKDTAGTTPVTADGDLVARMNDKSGNGFHVIQATSGARPIYRAGTGGKHYLEGDSARWLETSTTNVLTNANGEWTGGVAINFDTNTGSQHILSRDDGTTRVSSLFNAAGVPNSLNFYASGNSTETGPAITATTANTLIERTSVTEQELFVNGVSDGSTDTSFRGNPLATASKLAVMGQIGGFNMIDGKFFAGAIYLGLLGSADRALFNTWLAGKM
jgi:hypothetical protein